MSRPATDLRRRLLDASLALVDEGGIAALSMREVSRRAGVTHGAPYHYFPDRAAILAALAEEGFVALRDALRDATTEGTPRERFEACGRAYVAFALDHRARFSIMFRPELWEPLRHPSLDAASAEAFGVLVEIVAAGPWGNDPAMHDFVVATWSTAHGLASLLLDGPLGRRREGSQEPATLAVNVSTVMGPLFDQPPRRSPPSKAPRARRSSRRID
jgi:AcrR family transcriptional regulator